MERGWGLAIKLDWLFESVTARCRHDARMLQHLHRRALAHAPLGAFPRPAQGAGKAVLQPGEDAAVPRQ
eukprot:2470450-Lingulodinium_polyedra.AAC.1